MENSKCSAREQISDSHKPLKKLQLIWMDGCSELKLLGVNVIRKT